MTNTPCHSKFTLPVVSKNCLNFLSSPLCFLHLATLTSEAFLGIPDALLPQAFALACSYPQVGLMALTLTGHSSSITATAVQKQEWIPRENTHALNWSFSTLPQEAALSFSPLHLLAIVTQWLVKNLDVQQNIPAD